MKTHIEPVNGKPSFSYMRWSTPQQEWGDSEHRQASRRSSAARSGNLAPKHCAKAKQRSPLYSPSRSIPVACEALPFFEPFRFPPSNVAIHKMLSLLMMAHPSPFAA
jgi:hypothetical protein